MPINKRIDKLYYIHTTEDYTTMKMNEPEPYTLTKTNFRSSILSGKKNKLQRLKQVLNYFYNVKRQSNSFLRIPVFGQNIKKSKEIFFFLTSAYLLPHLVGKLQGWNDDETQASSTVLVMFYLLSQIVGSCLLG